MTAHELPSTRKKRVAILFGGRSAEHEISILSAKLVADALDRERFDPILVGIDKEGRWHRAEEAALLLATKNPRLVALNAMAGDAALVRAAAHDAHAAMLQVSGEGAALGVDVVFPVLHGPQGEDGAMQGLLTLAGVPFVGASILGSAVGMDKDVMKRLLRDAGLPIVPHVTLRARDNARDRDAELDRAAALGFPSFVKPANMGSSVGVSRATDRASLDRGIDEAFRFDEKVLVEAGVSGAREIECAVLDGDTGPETSGVGEIVVDHADGFYSYDAKYVDEHGARLEIPATIDDAVAARVRDLAARTFVALECEGLARVDFFLDGRGEIFVNEINTMPGFTAVSMFPRLWAAAGIDEKTLVTRLVMHALARDARRRRLETSNR